MAIRRGDRYQKHLFPPSIEEYVGKDDPVRAYDAFIDALPFDELDIKDRKADVGNSNYEPKTMLKILVYAYSYGWQSSRKIERALHHNLSFIWLSGGLKPDNRTIRRFNHQYPEQYDANGKTKTNLFGFQDKISAVKKCKNQNTAEKQNVVMKK